MTVYCHMIGRTWWYSQLAIHPQNRGLFVYEVFTFVIVLGENRTVTGSNYVGVMAHRRARLVGLRWKRHGVP